jgi:hypothetical protein
MQVFCLNAKNEKVIKGQTEVTVAI